MLNTADTAATETNGLNTSREKRERAGLVFWTVIAFFTVLAPDRIGAAKK
jgi:hypothetical protein